MLGSPVPMVPLAMVAASALGSYSRFLVSERARDKEIELEREREREILPAKKTVASLGAFLGRVRYI